MEREYRIHNRRILINRNARLLFILEQRINKQSGRYPMKWSKITESGRDYWCGMAKLLLRTHEIVKR